MRVDRSATWEAISKVSWDAILLRQANNATRAFQECICSDCPDRNGVCVDHPCLFAKRTASRLIDIMVEMKIGDN